MRKVVDLMLEPLEREIFGRKDVAARSGKPIASKLYASVSIQ